ncbi:MAG: 23S rRNA (adenine(2503)-C(2))-methyltransferase RlmN [Armatimonadota bacterium]
MDKKSYLVGMTTDELTSLAIKAGQPAFRGKQLADWIYKKNAAELSEMTNLPATFRDTIAEEMNLHSGSVADLLKSRDGTAKYLINLDQGQSVETVLLPYKDRVSACVSTQVGCGVGCRFCATGIHGLERNLSAGEIVDQVLILQKESQKRISHVVYMGMGEPLFNYDNTVKSIRLLNDEVGIAMRHITVSTVGIVPRIKMLAKEDLQITLAISLHSPDDERRERLIPIASRFPLKDLIPACKEYSESTRRRITFEYMLLKDVNDSISDAHELGKLLRGIMANVNLIPYNHVEGLPYEKPTSEKIGIFKSVLENVGLVVVQRMEKGGSVAGACGQLRYRKPTE